MLVWGAVLARETGLTPESLTPALPGGSDDAAGAPAAPPAPAAEGVEFGIALPTEELGSAGALAEVAGRPPQRVSYLQSWARDSDFDAALADQLREQDMQPFIAWQPGDPDGPETDQPEFALATIIDGEHDDYIRRWAEQIRDWGHPLWIRFAYEMNEDIHPWSVRVNGNSPDQYARAYQHVVDIFRDAGATNVAWNWSVAVQPEDPVPLDELYPGDDYVDELGVDGYNAGSELDWGGWRTFGEVFGPTLEELRGVSDKPIHISEVASSEEGGSKAEWITDFFAQLGDSPDIKGFTWFNFDKASSGEADWQIQTSPEAEQAFREGLATLE